MHCIRLLDLDVDAGSEDLLSVFSKPIILGQAGSLTLVEEEKVARS